MPRDPGCSWGTARTLFIILPCSVPPSRPTDPPVPPEVPSAGSDRPKLITMENSAMFPILMPCPAAAGAGADPPRPPSRAIAWRG